MRYVAILIVAVLAVIPEIASAAEPLLIGVKSSNAACPPNTLRFVLSNFNTGEGVCLVDSGYTPADIAGLYARIQALEKEVRHPKPQAPNK